MVTQANERVTQENDAWQEYRREVRKLDGVKYEEVEPWAWDRLQKKLLTIHKRRPKAA